MASWHHRLLHLLAFVLQWFLFSPTLMAEFTDCFYVHNSSAEEYEAFIRGLRETLADGYLHNLLPVLPQEDPHSYLDVPLGTENRKITVRLLRGNVYLVGYQMGSTGTWWEFESNANPPSQLIDGSSCLGYDGGYNGLEKAAKVRGRNDIALGKYKLIDAVNTLDNPERQKEHERARFLIVVIRMICESIRFTPISDCIFTNYEGFNFPEEWMISLEGNWGRLSRDFREGNWGRLSRDFLVVPLRNGTRCESVDQLLGIVKDKPADKPGSFCSKRKRDPRDVDYVQCLHGRPLVEVFSVRINDIDGQDEDNLYGNITITDGLGSQNIFKDGESIRQGENACLIGPARSISADDSFTIHLDLKDRYRKWFLFPREHNVSNGQISWNVYDTNNEYDKLLSKEVRSQYGSVTVNYAVLSDAVEATVEVTFENKDGESSADIYGWITARNVVSESELFRKAKNERIDVKHGKKIPLSRSVVAVQLNSALIVSAELWDHYTILPDKDIAKHTAEFPAQRSNASEEKISGEYGAIKVKVTWNKNGDTIPEVILDSEKYPPRYELLRDEL